MVANELRGLLAMIRNDPYPGGEIDFGRICSGHLNHVAAYLIPRVMFSLGQHVRR
jgi:hypothetical protein